ncbi:hypothetical protein TanjilG_06655 [Lupinus angustifolius]|uniref:NAD(P)H dehydrogenase (quinone) n=1 Tax=Lupinus angustifolius TaxID=3871 RepID=A0A1J7H5F6_LUPAN|nr:PREDICTED: NADPH:quinone oxidoreductase-like [Lupinus angustifolius]OIW08112.1 hypothetical protein TanjilG_06655 [Lupinus angustifolius]
MAAAPVKIVALSGSSRKASYHSGLIRAAIQISAAIDALEVEFVDISALPFVNTDLENQNGAVYPPVVEALRKKIIEADAVLFASPEYNYSLAPLLKNAIDWASRPPNVWAGKAAAVISTGGGFGGGRSQYHLRQVGVFLDLHFINKPEFVLNAFQPPAKFNDDGDLIDDEAKTQLKEILLSLQAFTLRLRA